MRKISESSEFVGSFVRSLFQFANAIPGRRRQRASDPTRSSGSSRKNSRDKKGDRRDGFGSPRCGHGCRVSFAYLIFLRATFLHISGLDAYCLTRATYSNTYHLPQSRPEYQDWTRVEETRQILGRVFPPAPMHNNKTRPERRKFPAAFPAMHCGRDSFSSLFYSLSCHQ